MLSKKQFNTNNNNVPQQNNNNINSINSITNTTNTINTTNTNITKEIIFGIGGGGVCYQLGIAKFIINNYDNDYLRDNFYFGGASAGSITTLILCSVLHGVDTIDQWFNEFVIEIIKKISEIPTGALFKINTIINETITNSYNRILKHTNYDSFLNDKYHMVATELPYINKKVLTNITSANDLVNNLISSCYAPLLSNGMYNIHNENRYTDGIYCNKIPYRFDNTEKLYFSIINQEDVKCNTINIQKWGNLSVFDLWLWGDINLCKRLFFKGYEDANIHKDLFHSFFLRKNKKECKLTLFYENLLNKHDIDDDIEIKNKTKTKTKTISTIMCKK